MRKATRGVAIALVALAAGCATDNITTIGGDTLHSLQPGSVGTATLQYMGKGDKPNSVEALWATANYNTHRLLVTGVTEDELPAQVKVRVDGGGGPFNPDDRVHVTALEAPPKKEPPGSPLDLKVGMTRTEVELTLHGWQESGPELVTADTRVYTYHYLFGTGRVTVTYVRGLAAGWTSY